jgi:hypothetical protein
MAHSRSVIALPSGLVRRIGTRAGLRALGVGHKGLRGRAPWDRDHLFIRLGDPGRAEAMGFKHDVHLPCRGRWAFSTGHDSLLAPMVAGARWAFWPGAVHPETRHHSWGVVGIAVCLSRTLSTHPEVFLCASVYSHDVVFCGPMSFSGITPCTKRVLGAIELNREYGVDAIHTRFKL